MHSYIWVDGDNGTYCQADSIEQVVVKSSGSQELRSEELATIVATVYVYDKDEDNVDFFYAAKASNPVWVYIDSVFP